MMMIYPARNNRRKRKNRLITTAIVCIFLLFIILANVFFPHFLTPLAQTVAVPMMHIENAFNATFGGFIDILNSKESLVEQNQALEEQLALTNALKAERDSLSLENQSLKALLGRTDTPPTGIFARVISKPGYSPYDTFIIDAGSSNHVQVSDLVYVDQSVLVGHVTSVGAHASTVELYSSPDEKNQVLVGPEALETTASGLGGGTFEIRLPQNADVHEGDVVTFSDVPTAIFGTVASILATPSDSFEQILFRSPVDISEISGVLVEPYIQPHASSTNNR